MNMIVASIKRNPLPAILLIAIILRALAVLFSKGFMASDDHFETVRIAYEWLTTGALDENGYIKWHLHKPEIVSRFPIYNIYLYGLMKINLAFGVESLNGMMYSIRAVHALLSLLTVYAVFRIVELASASRNWAAAAGLLAAAHFGMPYLSVRNLIEVVGGHFWILVILALCLYGRDRAVKWLIIAGILTGLAWMVRFQLALAALPVPFLLWSDQKKLRPAMIYSGVVTAMILLSGLADQLWMGTFMGTTLNYIKQSMNEGALYHTSHFIYVGVILVFFIPPLSLVVFFEAARKRFWMSHKYLCITSAVFILIHTLSANRQERFMIPIVPVLIVIFVLALHKHWTEKGFLYRKQTLGKGLLWFSGLVNLLLLVTFTINYGHRGLVEPLVLIERERTVESKPLICLVSPERGRIYPLHYTGLYMANRTYLYDWKEMVDKPSILEGADYYILYPPTEEDLDRFVDSLTRYTGPLRQQFHVGPSVVDFVLQELNPKFNKTNEAWVFVPDSSR